MSPVKDTLGSWFMIVIITAIIGVILAAGFFLFVEPQYQEASSLPLPDNPVLRITCGNCGIGCSLQPPDQYENCWLQRCEVLCG